MGLPASMQSAIASSSRRSVKREPELCPYCGAKMKEYPFTLRKGIVRALVKWHKRHGLEYGAKAEVPLQGGEMELLFEDRNSIAFGPTRAGKRNMFFTHNRDILAVPVKMEKEEGTQG